MTSQVSSPAEQADEPVVGERQPDGGVKDVRRLDRVIIRFAGGLGRRHAAHR
ncbi:hypothetical protein QFZ74_003642 [Streptomyces sp. V3I7]|nr:hypothetical protein [Streptomyces sp. V3I7]